VARLKNADLVALLSAIAELNSDFDPRTLPERAMKAALRTVNADSVAFTGITYDGRLSGLVWDSSEAISPEEIEIFGLYIHEQPLFAAYLIERHAETLQITDLMPAEKFERTNVYNEFYRRVGVRNQLVSPLSVSGDLLVTCSMNTDAPGFSERDRLIISLLAPHLVGAIRSALAYERLTTALDAQASGIIAVSSDGKPQFVSEFARGILEKYFAGEKRAANALPETLRDWIKQANAAFGKKDFSMPPEPLKIRGADGELTVRLMFNETTRERTLLLDEKKFSSPKAFERLNLTPREAEILFFIAQGKSDDIIAALCRISPRTVHKHVENIYAKLGVENRTAAMLRALEML
jgi:DNA-binding CsgD family transcriptional regulator